MAAHTDDTSGYPKCVCVCMCVCACMRTYGMCVLHETDLCFPPCIRTYRECLNLQGNEQGHVPVSLANFHQ